MSSDRAWAFLLHDVCRKRKLFFGRVAHICGVSVVAARRSRLVRGRREIHDKIAADPQLASILDRGAP